MKPLNLNKEKKPNKFFEKVKNFFTIPEEVFKEEEGTKKFESMKLFTLTKEKIFLGISLFLILINFLVGYDIDFLYLRQILAFLFLIIVPGLLIMLCFKIRKITFWEYLVYTVGLSIAFIMFAGLAVNWTLPALGITDQPLSLYPILVCFNIFLIALGITAWCRNKDLKPFDVTVPKLDTLNNIFFIIPMTFPILAILGAFLLNNHGPNYLTMIMLGAIAIYVLLLTIFRKKLNENIWPWCLYWMGLALLLSFSMRSWYVSGVDTNLEFSIFKMTLKNGFWSINSFKSTYNAMLSVTILPTTLYLFLKFNAHYVSKVLFSIIFSFLLIIVYRISNKYVNKNLSFFAGLFFIFQTGFMNWNLIPSRQEISFVFFGLVFLVLSTTDISSIYKKTLVLIFVISMIVSHYTTAYISITLILLVYTISRIYNSYKKNNHTPNKRYLSESNFVLTGLLILLFLIFGFLWYSQLTPTSEGLIDFVGKSISNFGNLFNKEVQSEGGSIMDQFNIFPQRKESIYLLQDYENSLVSNLTSDENFQYKISILYAPGITPLLNHVLSYSISLFKELLKFLGKLFVIMGFCFLFLRREEKDIDLLIPYFSFLSLLLLLLILPFISIQYDVIRVYQQILILLSVGAMIGAFVIFRKIFQNKTKLILSFFLILYFFVLVGISNQIIGGTDIDLKLNNNGLEYTSYYVNSLELQSSLWLSNNIPPNNKINADERSTPKIYLLSNPKVYSRLSKNLYPPLIKKENYVYSSTTNKVFNITYSVFRGNLLSIKFPTEFVNKNKNKVYNNGGSEIFK